MARSPSGLLLCDIVYEIGGINVSGWCKNNVVRKDCIDLSRRIAILVHLFQEIHEFKGCHLDDGAWAKDVWMVLKAAKKVLGVAAAMEESDRDDGSKKITSEIESVTWHLERVLGKVPYSFFGVSEEVQEQVELVRSQLRRAIKRYGPLSSKVLSCISKTLDNDDRRVIGCSLVNVDDRVARNEDFRATVETIDYTLKGDNKVQLMQDFVVMGNFSSCLKDDNQNEGKLARKSSVVGKSTESIAFPDDFRCPISLELMKDPVIVATGQTYERSCIQRWVDGSNLTCPKTQQVLENLTLTPNYVLRSLITQWCEKNKIVPPTGLVNGRIRGSDGSFHKVTGEIDSIRSLVRKLSSRSLEEQRNAASEIRTLSKRSTDNRILIAEAGAIPILVTHLTSEDVITQENAVTAILNLSIFEDNKGLIMLAGAVSSIVQVIRMGTPMSKENAAATLFSLSLLDENKITIGASGAIPALVALLQNGSSRGKKDALTALFNLCIYQGNKGRALRAGILVPLMKMLTDPSSSMVDESLTILSLLASHQEGKAAIVKANAIPILIDLLRSGPARNKENAASILLLLCKKDPENLACIARLGAAIPLSDLANSGTERAKRKSISLLEYLSKLKKL